MPKFPIVTVGAGWLQPEVRMALHAAPSITETVLSKELAT